MILSLTTLCVLPTKAMQSGSIQSSTDTEKNLLHDSEVSLTRGRNVRGAFAITVGLGKLAKVAYLALTLNRGINTVDEGTQGEIVIVTETSLGICCMTYGVLLLLKWING